ncbi:MAG: RNAase P [Candidatus Thermoplasmatota archaeon]
MARRNKGEERTIAKLRVERLVKLAVDALRSQHEDRAHRYAEHAWRLKTAYKLRGSAIDGRVCRKCHAFLQPGRTSRVRLTGGKRTTTCLRCGAMRRRPIHPM